MSNLPKILVGGTGPDIAPDILDRLMTACADLSRRENREAAQKVGQELHDLGGIELMRAFFYECLLQGLDRERKAKLEFAWDGVGDWQW